MLGAQLSEHNAKYNHSRTREPRLLNVCRTHVCVRDCVWCHIRMVVQLVSLKKYHNLTFNCLGVVRSCVCFLISSPCLVFCGPSYVFGDVVPENTIVKIGTSIMEFSNSNGYDPCIEVNGGLN